MPSRLRKPCAHPGCPELTLEGYCRAHKQDARRYDRARGTATQRGYGSRWQRYRLVFLRQHPLCVECLKAERLTVATEVDHIIPHKGNYGLFWSPDNHQALCKHHHSKKTAKENGGFNNS